MSNMSKFANIEPMEDMEFEELLQQVEEPAVTTSPSPAKIEDSIDEVIKSLEARFLEATNNVNQAVMNRADVTEVGRLMSEAEATNQQLQYFQNVKSARGQQPATNPTNAENVIQPRVGLTLSRRDLPKFQLKTDSPRPFPSEEVFESAEHFLRAFEKILVSANMDIEKNWVSLLLLCL